MYSCQHVHIRVFLLGVWNLPLSAVGHCSLSLPGMCTQDRKGAKKIVEELLNNQPGHACGGSRNPTPNGLSVTGIKFSSASWTEHSPVSCASSYFSVRGGSKEDDCLILGSKSPSKYAYWSLTPSLEHNWSDWSLKVNLSSVHFFSGRRKHLYYHEVAT